MTNRILKEYDVIVLLGEDQPLLPVHTIELELDFEAQVLFVDLDRSDRPGEGARRVMFPLFEDKAQEEDYILDLLRQALEAYHKAGFDWMKPGPNQPPPKGILAYVTCPSGKWLACSVQGIQKITSENMVLFAPLRVITS